MPASAPPGNAVFADQSATLVPVSKRRAATPVRDTTSRAGVRPVCTVRRWRTAPTGDATDQWRVTVALDGETRVTWKAWIVWPSAHTAMFSAGLATRSGEPMPCPSSGSGVLQLSCVSVNSSRLSWAMMALRPGAASTAACSNAPFTKSTPLTFTTLLMVLAEGCFHVHRLWLIAADGTSPTFTGPGGTGVGANVPSPGVTPGGGPAGGGGKLGTGASASDGSTFGRLKAPYAFELAG